MVSANDVMKELEKAAKKIYEKEETKRVLMDWIYGWHGKLVRFRMDDSEFYLVFTPKEVKILTGNYPGSDVDIICSLETWEDLWKTSLMDLSKKIRSFLREDKLIVHKNFNDFRSFIMLMKGQ